MGYFALHHFEKQIGQKKVIILRGEAGILPEYRKNRNVITIFNFTWRRIHTMEKDMDWKLSYLYHSSMFYLQPIMSLFLILGLISRFMPKTDLTVYF